MRIGYVGLGAMGGALARRLLAAHPDLAVSDINRAAVAEFEKLGAFAAPSHPDLARRCDVLVLCLPRSSAVREVVFGPGGLAEGLSAGKIVIDQTSGVPGETREIAARLAERGVSMIDAPVAGGVPAAQEGTILIMISGPDKDCEKATPVLQAISPNVIRCGERVGDAHAMKLVNNTMNAVCRLGTLEAVAMGRKMGLSLESMTDVLNNGAGRSRISKVVLPAMMEGRPSSSFSLALMLKDVNETVSLGMECGVPMPLASVVRGLLQIGVNTLGETAQLEDVVRLIESMAATRLVEPGSAASPPPAVPAREKANGVGGDQLDSGRIATLVAAAVAACNRFATYESAAMGFKYGLTAEAMATVINKGSGWSDASERILPALASGDRTADLRLQDMVKDLQIAARMGMGSGAPMMVANTVLGLFEAATNLFPGRASVDEIAHLIEGMAGIRFASA